MLLHRFTSIRCHFPVPAQFYDSAHL